MTGRFRPLRPALMGIFAIVIVPLVQVACHRQVVEMVLPAYLGADVASTGRIDDGELSAVLAEVASAPFAPLPDTSTRKTLAHYLAALQRIGPATRPERFPSLHDRLAYLVNAHVAWTIALHDAGGLAPRGLEDVRAVRVPLDGGTSTLAAMEDEIAHLAPGEPRLTLFLNPGLVGGPPLPAVALEGDALTFQTERQAVACGRSPGFWSLDPSARRLGVSLFTEFLPGLPTNRLERTRKLLALLPPASDLMTRINATCEPSIERCTVFLVPL